MKHFVKNRVYLLLIIAALFSFVAKTAPSVLAFTDDEIAGFIQAALESKEWTPGQIASALEQVGVSEARVQSVYAAGSDSETAAAISQAYAAPEPPPIDVTPYIPPPPDQPAPVVDVYVPGEDAGSTYNINLSTGNITVAGSNESVGYFNAGVFTTNNGQQGRLDSLVGGNISYSNQAGAVSVAINGATYGQIANTLVIAARYSDAVASGDQGAIQRAKDAARAANLTVCQ